MDNDDFVHRTDFVWAAIKRLIREEHHRRIQAQIQRETMGTDEAIAGEEHPHTLVKEWFKRLEDADRGGL